VGLTTELPVKYSNRHRDQASPESRESPHGAGASLSRARHGDRKARQLCRQVQRALNLALADRHEDDGLNELFDDDVTPAPDCARLLVHVVIPASRSLTAVMASLRQDTPRLRSEVATAISRKRAPELSFVPAMPEDGGV
jgi:ribosome-binding factor A